MSILGPFWFNYAYCPSGDASFNQHFHSDKNSIWTAKKRASEASSVASTDAFGDTHINAFGDTHINAFGDTHINAFGDTHVNAFGDTHIKHLVTHI